VAIGVLAYFLPGVSYQANLSTLAWAAMILAVFNALLKPVLKLILMPINFLTLGLAGWAINVLILYLTTLVVPGFSVGGYSLGPFTWGGWFIPLVTFSATTGLIVAAFCLNLLTRLIGWSVD